MMPYREHDFQILVTEKQKIIAYWKPEISKMSFWPRAIVLEGIGDFSYHKN